MYGAYFPSLCTFVCFLDYVSYIDPSLVAAEREVDADLWSERAGSICSYYVHKPLPFIAAPADLVTLTRT